MKSLIQAIVFAVFLPFLCYGQQLTRAEKKIEAALKTHLANLAKGTDNNASGLRKISPYLIRQFEKIGVKPGAVNDSWQQPFSVDKGRFYLPSSSLSVNGKSLQLGEDFFPFYFSVNKALDATVAIALAEDGVPWFEPLSEILDTDNNNALKDTLGYILSKANKSADKGATALFIFNNAPGPELTFHEAVPTKLSSIPVVYITGKATKKYLGDESESLEIKLHTALEEQMLSGDEVMGYVDSGADTTLVIGASSGNDENIAALIEISRALKKKKKADKNYLFVVTENPESTAYCMQHVSPDKKKTISVMNLDSFSSQGLRNGLNKVNGVLELVEKR